MRPRCLSTLWAIALTLLTVAPARALDPERLLSQYARDHWGPDRGFPGGPVYAIAQTPDGYLWIGAERGLVRFDGRTFRLYEPTGLAADTGPTVLGLAVAADGSLWARLRGPALVRFADGRFDNLLATTGLPDAIVTAMRRGAGNAVVLAMVGRGAVAVRDGQVHPIVAARALPRSSLVVSMAQITEDETWLGTRDAGLVRVRAGQVSVIRAGLPDPKVNCLLEDADGSLWIGTDRGVVRWAHDAKTTVAVPVPLRDVAAHAMLRDRDQNVWIVSATRGLLRVTAGGSVAIDDPASRVEGTVSTVFEDREGNIWVGTSRGIARLRDAAFATYSTAQGLPSEGIGPIHADAAGRTWFAPQAGGLFYLREGVVHAVTQAGLQADVIYSIAGTADEVWVGRQHGGLTRLRGRGDALAADEFTHAAGLAQDSVYAVHQARNGAVWAGTLSGGASRLADGVITTYTRADGLASNTVTAIAESADGTMWFGTPSGVSALASGRWRHFTSRDGLPSDEVGLIETDGRGTVWVGTAAGLVVWRGDRFAAPPNLPAPLRGPILGLVEDRAGFLWVTTADRVLRLPRDGLVQGTVDATGMREFGALDGLLAQEGVKRQRSVTIDAHGRVWMATTRGVSVTDPSHAARRTVPALVRVDDASADGEVLPVRDAVTAFTVPAGRRRVTVSYTGVSLAVPDRVLYRYRLDGFDRDWSAPVAERHAVFTNLGPGTYRFRVVASNSDGLWNSAEATARFTVAPAYWQTRWFQVSAVLAVALAGWAVYAWRVGHVARQLNVRFEERLAERTRIAQALHDTLLQGFVSASMQLHVVADRLPADSAARPALVRVQDLMHRVIDEGRNAVRGLRATHAAPGDLEQAFTAVRQEVAVPDTAAFRLMAEGRRRPLNPVIRDEVYRIGREALVNAFRHSGAANVELELEYASRDLRLLVRDDGCGIDPDVARAGVDGHWGLSGMRERAADIGAAFKVRSRASAGTEVELIVPARVAFDAGTPPRGRRLLARWMSRSALPGRRSRSERAS